MTVKNRTLECVKATIPTTTRFWWWLLRLTIGVSFCVMILKFVGILPYLSSLIAKVMQHFGLPGEAAFAYVTGYFINCYSALAIMSTLDLDARALTILCTMVLCSHSMIVETAVLKKTGASAAMLVALRTVGAFLCAYVLNLIMPGGLAAAVNIPDIPGQPVPVFAADLSWAAFLQALRDWIPSVIKLSILLTAMLFLLNILQRLMIEFGIMDKVAKVFHPLLAFFGLPRSTSYIWIVANVVGLSYGSAALMDVLDSGHVTKDEAELFDLHVCISHSNVEDLTLMGLLGGIWWIMLMIRLALSMVYVWGARAIRSVRA